MKFWGDLETYNEVDIRVGTHRYAETAEVLLFAWAVDDGAVQVWDATADPTPPTEMVQALHAADEVWFHNSHFDRTVLRHAMPDLVPPLERWRDTMVQAMAHSLPASLGVLGAVLKLPQDMAKDKRGKSLIQLFCKPRPKNMKLRRATRESHPAEWADFVSYARDDIVAMRECHKRMPMWNYRGSELALWHLDQRINDRGVAVDLELAEGAVNAVAREQERLAQQTLEMTDGQVQAATQRNAILTHIAAYHGIFLDDLRGSTVERKLEDPDIPEPVKDLLRVRLAASTTSTAKYHALIKSTSSDGRLRGLLQFNGAARTGRWCLAEGSLVRTKDRSGRISDTPIELVTCDQQVWDGVEWVDHEGVVFSGKKEVIHHDGITATKEHIVYLNDVESVTLGEAKHNNLKLWAGNQCSTFTS